MRALSLLAGLCLALLPPAAAQQQRHRSVHTENGRTLEVEVVGAVRFSDDDRSVRSLSPGGWLTIEERGRGLATRRVEYRAGEGGGLRRSYREEGRERDFDAAAAAWEARVLLEAIRGTGVGAEERVARILARGGAEAVLREIRQVPGDGAKSRYFRALLSRPLAAAEAARALREAGEQIDSDGDLAALLTWAAGAIEPDREPAREAFFAAAGSIGSDGDRHAVLASLLRRGRVSEPMLLGLLRSAAGIGSDGDLAALLARVAEGQRLGGEAVREALFRAVAEIGSDGDRAMVLTRLLRVHGADRALVLAAIGSARGIGSDGDKAGVLTQVPAAALRADEVASAYAEVMRTIGSDGDQSRVALHLLAARRS